MNLRVFSGLATILVLQASAAAANPSERLALWEWSDVPRVVAVGDLHGGHDKLEQLLESAELVDDALRWVGGEAHLVVAGDLLDRGDGDRPLMDLLRRLQEESAAAGGRVHVLLGNHEVMNLLRDTRDVTPASHRDFAELEDKKTRKAALRQFLAGENRGPGNLGTFNRRYPHGFFGRQAAFDREGEYGGWLLRQPVIVKINDVAYVHGGLTEEFASLGIDGINRRVMDELNRHLEQREVLEAAGVVTPIMNYAELRQAAEKALGRRGRNGAPDVSEAARAFLDSADSPILGARGPLWYRGNSFEDERLEAVSLDRCLELVEAETLVVAHSYTGANRITSRFHGRLYRLDHGMTYSPRPLALVAEAGEMMVLNAATRRTSEPVPEPPNGLAQPPESVPVSDGELERFLLQAKVTQSRDLGRGTTRPRLVVLEKNGGQRRGIFKAVEERDGAGAGKGADRYQHEVAAYRLDRRLGLDLVPVTVIREIDGRRGSLQWWVKGAVDGEAAAAYGLDPCAAADRQLALGRVFDALIGNPGRTPSDVLCVMTSERLYLIDHSEAFPTSPELPAAAGALVLTPDLAAALRALDRRSLAEDLGELLGERQIEALLARRDEILATSLRP